MELTIDRFDDILIARVAGRLEGLTSADALQKALEEAIRPADRGLILDFETLTYISSAGLRAIAILINRTRKADMGFVICALSAPVRSLFATSGFDKLVRVADTFEDAWVALWE